MAAPAWRQFSFFGYTQYPTAGATHRETPEILQQPHLISAVHSNPTLGDGVVILADLDGTVHWLNEEWQVEHSWRAYDGGRVQWMETSMWDKRRGRAILVTVGDDASTPFPLLKVWLLTLSAPSVDPSPSSSNPTPHLTLLRQTPIAPTPNRPSPVSSLAVAPSISHIVVGLTDGTVVGWKHVDELIESSLNDLEAVARAADVGTSSTAGKGRDRTPQFVVGGMGKLRILWEGNKEPITNIAIAASSSTTPTPTLFILTTSQILAVPLPPSHGSKNKTAPTVLDDLGAAVGCAKIMRLGIGRVVGEEGETAERMVVAREEAIYVYGSDGREGCWAYEGPKSAIYALHTSSSSSAPSTSTRPLPSPYLAILTPPLTSSLASNSATIRQHARTNGQGASARAAAGGSSPEEQVAKVTVFDPENKFIAFSGAFGDGSSGDMDGAGVREVMEAWGAVWVLTESGKLFRLFERPLQSSLSTLFQRNLYTLAVSLAQSRGLGKPEVGEIYRRYGDHLYSKGDYEGAMGCYLKTVGTVQASYVIRKFLDAQRLTHLTSYLQELHSRNLANSDITTLLLNCYTKLADDEALSRFIHSSSSHSSRMSSSANGADTEADEPPFDLETAIRVLRQASYFSHAIWLAERYHAHSEYLRIAIEDTSDYLGALSYVSKLASSGMKGEREEADESMKRWGGVLLAREPVETTKVLVEICCGTVREPAVNGAEANGSERVKPKDGRGRLADLRAPSPSEASILSTRRSAPGYDVPDSASPLPSSSAADLTASPRTASPKAVEPLPSPRQFFAHFVDHPREFIDFLEQVAERRYGKTLDSIQLPTNLTGIDAPLSEPRPLGAPEYRDVEARDEQAVWNTLLELYVTPLPSSLPEGGESMEDQAERVRLQAKAIKLLRSRDSVPYDETQALLVCTTKGFVEGFVLLYELLGMYDDIVRYWIDASTARPSAADHSSRIITSLRRYGPSYPSLYRTVLRHLTTSSDILSRHQTDVLDILDEIDERKIMPPIEVVQILSANGTASMGLVREYLKRQLLAEKQEIESDQALITSYRTESAKKLKEIQELSDPNVPRIFQVTRCSACGGQLDLPGVHFMCRHSYHQRCLGENEAQCPNCARTHGVVREIRKNNEQLAGRHDLFLAEVADSDDSFAAVASAFGRGFMGLTTSVG
ncbi:hypothetical protein JCM1840_006870 [Sporobolomyces johnsonii]